MAEAGSSESTAINVEAAHTMCEMQRGVLAKLFDIHRDILSHGTAAGERYWVHRLEKVGCHAIAIAKQEVDRDAAHVIATEVRAAYVQLAEIWEGIPGELKIDAIDSRWWSDEARNGVLAQYDHPSSFSVLWSAESGGLSNGDDRVLYIQLGRWIGYLGLGYGCGIAYLAQVMNVDVEQRLAAVIAAASSNCGPV